VVVVVVVVVTFSPPPYTSSFGSEPDAAFGVEQPVREAIPMDKRRRASVFFVFIMFYFTRSNLLTILILILLTLKYKQILFQNVKI